MEDDTTAQTANRTINDLTPAQQEAAHTKWLQDGGGVQDESWSECLLDAYRDQLETMGFRDVKFGYSLSYSQGDGACFTGSYLYAKGAPKQLLKDYPGDDEALAFAKGLQELQRRYFYNIYAVLTSIGATQPHEHSVHFSLDQNDPRLSEVCGAEDEFADLCRDFMRQMYKQLEREYEHLQSMESFKSGAECNQWTFDDEGKLSY